MDYAKRWKQVVSSIMLVKRSTQRVAYSSGGSNTQVDILARRGRLKKVWDAKLITEASVAKQHKLVVSKMVIWIKWRKTTRPEKRKEWGAERGDANKFREIVLGSGIMESEGG